MSNSPTPSPGSESIPAPGSIFGAGDTSGVGGVIAIIPARFGSTRFPGKPLAIATGKPLLEHVVQQVQQAKHVSRIIVATDDQRIYDAVCQFGCQAQMTSPDHPNGTSRIAQVVQAMSPTDSCPDTIIVNVQGDEPEIEPNVIDQLILGLRQDTQAPMATLASAFAEDEDPGDPNIVKLVVDQLGHALYFSRSLIPFGRDGNALAGAVLKHPGLYAYRRDFLLTYAKLPPTPLEQIEKLEQLRALEHGYKIAVVQTNCQHHGIDTPEQYEAFVKRYHASASTNLIKGLS